MLAQDVEAAWGPTRVAGPVAHAEAAHGMHGHQAGVHRAGVHDRRCTAPCGLGLAATAHCSSRLGPLCGCSVIWGCASRAPDDLHGRLGGWIMGLVARRLASPRPPGVGLHSLLGQLAVQVAPRPPPPPHRCTVVHLYVPNFELGKPQCHSDETSRDVPWSSPAQPGPEVAARHKGQGVGLQCRQNWQNWQFELGNG